MLSERRHIIRTGTSPIYTPVCALNQDGSRWTGWARMDKLPTGSDVVRTSIYLLRTIMDLPLADTLFYLWLVLELRDRNSGRWIEHAFRPAKSALSETSMDRRRRQRILPRQLSLSPCLKMRLSFSQSVAALGAAKSFPNAYI
jgi:hypothetical protein